MAVKQAFMREKERKTQEALNAIGDYRRAQWQKKVADSMEQFEVAGISQTHDEMVRKIEEMTAVNEARMEMAMGNVDQQKIKIEEEAEKLRAAELVKQFKTEMGLAAPKPRRRECRKNNRREGTTTDFLDSGRSGSNRENRCKQVAKQSGGKCHGHEN